MKIGILGASDIAYRRFVPALKKFDDIEYCGVATRTPGKGNRFTEAFGGEIYNSYESLIMDDRIDALYLPLPPALHFVWAKKALEAGKHVLLEKPLTSKAEEALCLISLAREKKLTLHENYMFLYHRQLTRIKQILEEGTLGELRLIRTAFGFPRRDPGDFRYNKALGGGALLDCGGYPVRVSLDLLGDSLKVMHASLVTPYGSDVELYGNAVLQNDQGETAQAAFGIDNSYKCELEIWGSQGCLMASRIFTAPPDMKPDVRINSNRGENLLDIPADDSFYNSIAVFRSKILSKDESHYKDMIKQAQLIDSIRKNKTEKTI